MNARGHTLLLLMTLVAALTAAAMLVFFQVGMATARHRDDDRRTQALWLARSAITAKVTGSTRVETHLGLATVKVTKDGANVVAVAELASATAKVTATASATGFDSWEERYDASK